MERGWVFFADVGKVSPHLLPKVSTEGWEKIHLKSWSFMDHSLSWKFEPSQTWLSFFLRIWGNFPPFLKKMRFCLGVWKKYIVNLDRLLIWTLSKIWHFYLFVDMGGTHLFCQKCEILLGDWKKFQPESLSKIGNDKDWGWENFHLQPWPFIGLSFSRKFEQSKTWLSFLSWFLGSSLFCKKIKIVLRDWKTFHLQTWSFNGLSLSWKFEFN